MIRFYCSYIRYRPGRPGAHAAARTRRDSGRPSGSLCPAAAPVPFDDLDGHTVEVVLVARRFTGRRVLMSDGSMAG
ncbi:hypothetical protein B1H29_05710 [Streptomyces pactum]|uniref:Uncharacterized protein n=1 Tax=Streptomyces pactum TaxID=68249 RepID=A0A1S6J418_9ACTN|nr:hypothetical protein B1H29_05710 [Streptomyces pactum]